MSPSQFISTDAPSSTCLQAKGFFQCGHKFYTACKHAKKTNSYTSGATGKTHNIDNFINCNLMNVVYLITYTACRLQYLGTSVLKIRICRHLSDSKLVPSTNLSMVSKHFYTEHGGDTSSFQFVGTERVHKPVWACDHKKRIFDRESQWIFCLKTRAPHGLNLWHDLPIIIELFRGLLFFVAFLYFCILKRIFF